MKSASLPIPPNTLSHTLVPFIKYHFNDKLMIIYERLNEQKKGFRQLSRIQNMQRGGLLAAAPARDRRLLRTGGYGRLFIDN